MGNFGGSYSSNPRTLLDDTKRYLGLLAQNGKPISDDDENLLLYIFLSWYRQINKSIFGSSRAIGDAWKIVGNSLNNNFIIKGGDGTFTNALNLVQDGLMIPSFEDANYDNDGSTLAEEHLHSVSTGLTATVLTDTAANYITNELVGRLLRPNISDATSFVIVSNTATTIEVSGDLTTVAEAGDLYLVEMSTPVGSDRGDYVWLNIYLDEIDSIEDASLIRTIETESIECVRALAIKTSIFVRQGDDTDLGPYTDSDGNYHFCVQLARIVRYDGIDTISSSDVIDDRIIGLTFDEIQGVLTNAKNFCGAPLNFFGMPTYLSTVYISNGDSLKTAIALLDSSLNAHNYDFKLHKKEYEFTFIDLPAGTSALGHWFGTIREIISQYNGYITGLYLQVGNAQTGGTLKAEILKNGATVGVTTLDCLIDGTNQNVHYTKSDNTLLPEYEIEEGDSFGIKFTADSAWAPVINDIKAVLSVVYISE